MTPTKQEIDLLSLIGKGYATPEEILKLTQMEVGFQKATMTFTIMQRVLSKSKLPKEYYNELMTKLYERTSPENCMTREEFTELFLITE